MESSDLDIKKKNVGEDQEEKVIELHETSNMKGDYKNVAILLFLYLLQGIPLGISSAVPILLQNRGVSYSEQAMFTFAFYPFTMKILWAPIVDSAYIKAIGRRKSWLVPAQIMIGVFMIYLAQNVDNWMGVGENQRPQMYLLTGVFFMLWFLTATQDIAVDGWALTMLHRRNVGHAATCNSVGQTAGGFIGYVVFLVLESKDFGNKYIFDEPRDVGIVTLSGFLQFWGIIFLGTTALVAIFKKESSEAQEEYESNPEFGIRNAYPLLLKIVKLKPIIKFSLVLLTVKASFAACDGITTLKLVEYGIPKDKIAVLSIPLVPIQILLPFIISRYTTGKYPMSFYIKAFPYRLILTVVIAAFVYVTPSIIAGRTDDIPAYYYLSIVTIYMIYQIPLKAMYVADMAFMAKISDPLVGGTYMTLLNTISNLGGGWVKTFFLWLLENITWKSCVHDGISNSTSFLIENKCVNKIEKASCMENGGKCQIDIDGYYIEVALNVVYGIIWYQWGKRVLDHLQSLDLEEWHVMSNHLDEENLDASVPLEDKMEKKSEIELQENIKLADTPNLYGDKKNIVILFFLYVLQGVPMGITSSMTVMLQNRGVSYSDQTLFTFAVYPFTLKILWAPIVDCVYFKAFGRRKTWLVPSQLMIGGAMLYLAEKVDKWFGDDSNEKPQMLLLTTVFFLLWFLTATQDIAVDGWSLTMLQRKNVGYAATTNCVGQSLGALLGFVVFLTLESKDFCNKFIFDEPRDEGLVRFSGFLRFWGISFIAVTTAIALFKRESSEDDEELRNHPDFGIKKAYPMLLKIIRLKPILLIAAIFSTVDISFATVDVITNLKLIDYGIPRDRIALFNIPSFIVQLTLPIIISKYTAGKYPMNVYFKAYPYRLFLSVVIALFVAMTPTMLKGKVHDIPMYYYTAILIIFFFYQMMYRAMNTADMSFYARVADPLVGGTYMTLMNISYIGGKLFKTLSLWMIDHVTWKSCFYEEFSNSTRFLSENHCQNDFEKRECTSTGGRCKIDVDGYYIEVALNIIFGIFWYQWARRIISYLQELPVSDWHVLSNQKTLTKDLNQEMLPLKNKV